MCGIVGAVEVKGCRANPVALRAAADLLYKRGPDDSGIWIENNVGLGHRRLAILDVTSAGHQPMVSQDGRYVIVHNGEIYNFRELRKELDAHTNNWRSERDELRIFADYANVLINLYIQLLIAPQRFTMVHAAAYKVSGGEVNILAGAGGIGKTAVLGYAVRERGLQLLGDDIVVLDSNGQCLAFPRAFVLKSYHLEGYADTFRRLRLPRWNFYSAKRFLIDNARFMGVAKAVLRRTGFYYKVGDWLRPRSFLGTVSPEDLFGKARWPDRRKLGALLT